MLKNYSQVKKYLDSFINYEKKRSFSYSRCLKLERVKVLMEKLKIPYSQFKVIHIAGTKGKGSVATFCAYILAASGFKVGLFTSPHFLDMRERIKILEKKEEIKEFMISKDSLKNILNEMYSVLEEFKNTELGRITFFEVYTAIAFKYFFQKKVDFVVLETGLGGRLDATNIVTPSVTILTHIDYDHTDKLGKTLKKIAYEKAGIIKRRIPVISSFQRRSVEEVLKEKAKEKKAELFMLGEDFGFSNVCLRKDYTLFDFWFDDFSLKDIKIIMKGKYQVENACLALAGLHILEKRKILKRVCFKEGLRKAFLEGRFEIVKKNPLIVLDVAHNLSSFKALKETVSFYFPKKRIILIFASSSDKPAEKMIKEIKGETKKIIFTRFSNPRSISPEELYKKVKIKEAEVVNFSYKALRKALSYYKKNDLILITGSFYLVAEIKKAFRYGVIS